MVDYQARQTDRGITVEIVTTRPIETTTLTDDLAAALTGVGLTRPTVQLRVVPTRDRDTRTGKLIQFVPIDTAVPRRATA